MKKRILFVSYTSDWTGPTNSLTLLLNHLRERYDVAVLAPGEGLFTQRMQREAIPFFSMSSLKKEAIFDMRKLIRNEKFDLVYGNNTSGTSRNALIAAKLSGKPFICHVREMGWGKSWRGIGYLRFANAVIAVSQACASSIRRFVPARRLHVVYNGIPFSTQPIDRAQHRALLLQESGFAPDDVLMTNVAHVCERKGQIHAVNAMRLVVQKVPNARLLLLGSLDREPDYVAKLEHSIAAQNLNFHVKILGFKENAVQLVQGADLFIHTANKEPHPRAVIEAMGAGLPGVGFAVDGVAETILDGETGYLIPVNDTSALAEKIVTLAAAPTVRAAFGTAGRQRVEALFSAEVTANRVAQVIDGVLNR